MMGGCVEAKGWERKVSHFDGVVWFLVNVLLTEVRPILKKESRVILERIPL